MRDKIIPFAAAILGTGAGYLSFRRAAPWTPREFGVLVLGAGMAGALALALTLRRS